jgi:hypothetical protein
MAMSNRSGVGRALAPWLLALGIVLGVVLPAQAAAPAAPSAQGVQRIQFASGATSATVSGYVSGGQPVRYVLYALANQVMTVQTSYETAPVIATISDSSGTVLGTAVGRYWSGVLPRSGDYYITVATPYDTGTYYSMRVDVVYPAPPPTPVPSPERVTFAAGATSASVNGYLPSATSKQYVLRALRNQVMTIQSWTAGGPYLFSVQGSNGVSLGGANGGQSWTSVLPATQDYVITLQSPADAPPASYSLVISIVYASPTPTPVPPPQIQEIRFPPGGTSTTVWGYVDSAHPARYVLRALGGQVMTVQLRTQRGNPARVAISTAAGIFLGAANQGESWSGTLPATQDYYLTVQAPTDVPGDNFSLWVSIR